MCGKGRGNYHISIQHRQQTTYSDSFSISSSTALPVFISLTVKRKMSLLSRLHIASKTSLPLNQLAFSIVRANNAENSLIGKVSRQIASEANVSGHEKWGNGGGFVHKSAEVHKSALIELGAVVQANAVVGANVHIGVGSVVGPDVSIGCDTVIGYNVALQNCSLGVSCLIHSGACIGQDGFGFTINEFGEVAKKPQLLKVKIGDFVEIGSNSCIDRGSWRDTVVGDNTKIDNLVQIGHNVVIGRCCMLCGQVGLGGSATLGDYVVLGGKAGVADHVTIASKVRVAAKSGVVSDLKEAGDYAGSPAVPAQEWRRTTVVFRRLGRHSMVSKESEADSKSDKDA